MPKTKSTTTTAKTKSVTTTIPKPPTTTKPKPYTGKRQAKQTPKATKSVSNDSTSILSTTSTSIQPTTSKKKTLVKPKNLKINCVVEGEEAPFSVNILSDMNIFDLKEAIHPKITTPESVKPKDLVLKLIKNGVTKKGLGKLSKNTPKLLDNELEILHTYFPAAVDKTRIHIIVQLPQQGILVKAIDEMVMS
jgi:hypothetical protein